MSIGQPGQTSTTSPRGCRMRYDRRHPRRRNKANRPSPPKSSGSKFRLDSRNWRCESHPPPDCSGGGFCFHAPVWYNPRLEIVLFSKERSLPPLAEVPSALPVENNHNQKQPAATGGRQNENNQT